MDEDNKIHDQDMEPNSAEDTRPGPGRPRKEGVPRDEQGRIIRDRKDPNVDPEISKARSAAGKKSQESRQKIEQTEHWRRRKGRESQALLDEQLLQLNQEMETYNWAPGLDRRDTIEFIQICASLLQDFYWKRSYPMQSEDFFNEIELEIEAKKFTRGWPDVYMRDLLTAARYTLAPERTGVKKLAVETATQFLEWAKNRKNVDSAFEQTVDRVKKLLPKLTDGSIYEGPTLPEYDPRLTPPEPIRSEEEQMAEYHAMYKQRELQGRNLISVTKIESPEERRAREQTELESQIILRKRQEDATKLALQQRQLLGDQAWNYLHPDDPDIFGSRPRPR